MVLTPEKLKTRRIELGYTQQEVADFIGVSQKSYQYYESGDRNPKIDKIDKLIEMFKLTEDTIVTEQEAPYASKQKQVIPLGKHTPSRLKPSEYADAFNGWNGLPMYNVPITASFVMTYRDTATYTPQYYLLDPRFRDCDFGAIITGDSMHSEIRHGDFVACKEITDFRFIVFGEIYYVVAKNGLETCKYVARMPKANAEPKRNGHYAESDYDNDMILLVPYNKAIDPSPLHASMIDRLYKVRGIVRSY